MTIADLHTLTGAYALHALSDEEAAAFERHLRDCPSCGQEVRELEATAARLGRAVAVTPPPALRARVLERIATERQDPPRLTAPSRGVGGPGRGAARFALAAALAAAAGFGGIAVWQHQEARDARNQVAVARHEAREVAAVLAAPDARATSGRLPGGASGTVVVSAARDRAALLTAGLPKPPSGRVYQLWFDDGGRMRDAGLLDPDERTGAVVLAGAVGTASGMGITVEPAGGSPQPTSDPVALMSFAGT